jgi:hypothetical protein
MYAVAGAAPVNGFELAEFFGMSNVDYAATIAIGAPVPFPENGVSTGGIIRNSGSQTDFILQDIGIYLISFIGSFNEPGQLTLWLDPNTGTFNRVINSTVGRATGANQISSNILLHTTVASSKIRIVNDSSPAALTVTPLPGGTQAGVVSLTIVRLS